MGVGGRIETKETPRQSAIREITEEIGVTVKSLNEVARLVFYFPYVKDHGWDTFIHVYVADGKSIKPVSSEEIIPRWFSFEEIPYRKQMWDDYRYWLPLVIGGKKIRGEFTYGKDVKVIKHRLQTGGCFV